MNAQGVRFDRENIGFTNSVTLSRVFCCLITYISRYIIPSKHGCTFGITDPSCGHQGIPNTKDQYDMLQSKHWLAAILGNLSCHSLHIVSFMFKIKPWIKTRSNYRPRITTTTKSLLNLECDMICRWCCYFSFNSSGWRSLYNPLLPGDRHISDTELLSLKMKMKLHWNHSTQLEMKHDCKSIALLFSVKTLSFT